MGNYRALRGQAYADPPTGGKLQVQYRIFAHSVLYACLGLLLLGAGVAPGAAPTIGTVPVIVTNPSDIAKAEGIQHPYVSSILCNFAAENDTFADCQTNLVQAPANQRLILEFVGANCSVPGTVVSFAVTSTVNGAGFGTFISMTAPTALGTFSVQSASQLVRIYVDAGSTASVQFGAAVNVTDPALIGAGHCFGSIQGQAIDVP